MIMLNLGDEKHANVFLIFFFQKLLLLLFLHQIKLSTQNNYSTAECQT
jgi:hypothetical protein